VNVYEGPVNDLIAELGTLPGIGPKSAQRIAFWLLDQPLEDVHRLAETIVNAKEHTQCCRVCFNLSQAELCRICSDPRRDPSLICVVEESKDIAAIERTGEFKGRYHVLHGAISPMEDVGPDDIRIKELLFRLNDGVVQEVIMATNPNLEGEATAMYIAKLIKPLGVKVTRIAHGVPVGGDLEFVDEVTLARALEGRRSL